MINDTGNKKFEKIFNLIKPDFEFCLMGYEKTKRIYDEYMSMNMHGNTAEIGVFMGFTSKILALINSKNNHFCYDTFTGVAGADANIDIHKDGDFKCSLEKVKKSINLPNVIYKVGIFPDTFAEDNMQFVFVHTDTDTYHGTKTTLENFKEILLVGGKIVCDDYKWKHCPGVEKAVHEFHEVHKNRFSIKEYGNQCILTKTK
jgi:hypothetical protein